MSRTATTTQAQRIVKARMGVILSAPFFGSLLMRLKMIEDPSVPTFRTDGKVIQYNPEFAASLSDAELRGVLVHEVCHCAQGHLWRCGVRHAEKWNHAADYAVNNMLETYVQEEKTAFESQHGKGRFPVPWSLPEGGLIDHAYDGLSSEEIYDRLPDGSGSASGGSQPGSSGGSSPQSSPSRPSCGEFAASPGDAEESAEAEREWKVAVVQAATVARMRGTLPASLQRLVGDLLEPKVPWRQVLREFIRQFARDDYSFRRPNRRYAGGVILPSLHSERMGHLVIAVDTSGSVTDHVLAEFQAEVQAALDECQPESMEVVYCDAAVNGVEEYQPGDTVRLSPKGGGGTAFEPVFEHVDQGEPPVACIYLTDGWGSFPKSEPDYPVLWASTDSDTFPFGQLVSVR